MSRPGSPTYKHGIATDVQVWSVLRPTNHPTPPGPPPKKEALLEVSRSFRNVHCFGSVLKETLLPLVPRSKTPLLMFSGRRGSSTNTPGWRRSLTRPGFGSTSVSSSKPSISKSGTFRAHVSVSAWHGVSCGPLGGGQARQLSHLFPREIDGS